MPSLGLKTVEKTRDTCSKLHKEVLKEMKKQQIPVEFLLAEAHIGCGLRHLDKLLASARNKGHAELGRLTETFPREE